MTEGIDDSPPSCVVTILGIIAVGFPAAMIVIWIMLIDMNDFVDLFIIILSYILIVALIMRAAWWATKRTKKWLAHLAETQSSEDEVNFVTEEE
jgi:hypothetical protein